MTVEESRKLLLAIQVAYPNYRPENMEMAVNLWASVMSDISFDNAMTALQTYIRTDVSGFAPSPGKLIQSINFLTGEQKDTAPEAWGRVQKAIRNGIYGCEEEFSKLPSDIQRAVGDAGQLRAWAICDEEYLGTVAKAQFEKAYNTITARSEKVSMLPNDMRAALEYHPEPKPEVKEIPYQIDKEAFRTGVNGDNVMELLERILGA